MVSWSTVRDMKYHSRRYIWLRPEKRVILYKLQNHRLRRSIDSWCSSNLTFGKVYIDKRFFRQNNSLKSGHFYRHVSNYHLRLLRYFNRVWAQHNVSCSSFLPSPASSCFPLFFCFSAVHFCSILLPVPFAVLSLRYNWWTLLIICFIALCSWKSSAIGCTSRSITA